MSLNLKQAAEELLKIADDIEKDAAEVTEFVCNKCNHTATLAVINGKRQETAKTAGEQVVVAEITVNDNLHCPACDGVMSYHETAASAEYYFDPDKVAKKEEEKAPEEGCEKEVPVDYDA
jgi:hypothetical protein